MAIRRNPLPGNKRRVRSMGQNVIGLTMTKSGRLIQTESFAELSWVLRYDRKRSTREITRSERRTPTDEQERAYRQKVEEYARRGRHAPLPVWEVSRRREAQARQDCAAWGWTYYVHTQETLPQGAELANLMALVMFRPRAYANHRVRDLALDALRKGRRENFCALADWIAATGHLTMGTVRDGLFHLLWHGDLEMEWTALLLDFGQPVRDACIWLPDGTAL